MSADLRGRIVFSSGRQGNYDLWMLDLDADRLVQLTSGNFWNDKPHFAPDGKSIYFVSNAGGVPGVYRLHLDGGQAEPIVVNGRWNDSPCLSPDGQRLAYVSNADDHSDLWLARPDGSNPQRLNSCPGNDLSVAWMPDGHSLIYTSQRGPSADLWRFDLGTGAKTPLNVDPGMDFHPAPSPDGRWIAFVSNRQAVSKGAWSDRDLDIWLMTADGEFPVRVTDNQGSDRCVSWSPDGTKLIYAATNPGSISERLRIVDVKPLLDAMSSRNEQTIQAAAENLRSSSLKIERDALEAELGAKRHPFFLTRFLPDFLMRPFYADGYFGSERYPHWWSAPQSGERRVIKKASASVS